MRKERSDNSHPQEFPRIDKDVINLAVVHFRPARRDESTLELEIDWINMEDNDPHLSAFLEMQAETYDKKDQAFLYWGAAFVYKILEGFDLPMVGEAVIERWGREYHIYHTTLENLSFDQEQASRELELMETEDSPYHFAQENPNLMVHIADFGSDRGRMNAYGAGAMFVYVLKRRQFVAE